MTSEPFPILNTSAEVAHHHHHRHDGAAKRRRKSSVLGSELLVGDTGAPGLASSKTALAATEGNGQVRLLLLTMKRAASRFNRASFRFAR
jgi:very-long-chain ceramide synthase